ncbi:MAG: hypothetical protein PHN69_03805 [Candidatus Pacebacteria bacterium]|nr:hypothetical protein [Candidatus Paceibacterota bacterium]
MALNLGQLVVHIGARTSDLERGLATAEKKLDSFARKASKTGRTLTLAITTPMMLVARKASLMAAEVIESENLFEISMGNMTDSAYAFSKEFSSSMKVNEYEMRKQMGIFKVMAESMGMPEEAAYELSKGFTTLAYDLASFYNISYEQAFEKLQSGMVGMVMPLRELGININETTVENFALRNGLIQQGETLSETGKLFARYGTIMEQSQKSHGNLAREIDNPLSQLRSLKEQVQRVTIEFGQALIPMLQRALEVAIPFVEKLRDMVQAFKDLSPEVQETYIKIGLLVALIGPAVAIIGGLAKGIKALVGFFKGLVGVITAVVAFGKKIVFAFSAWAGGAATLGEALSFLVGGPVGWVIGGIIALVTVGYLVIRNWKDISYWGLQTWGKVKKWIDNATASMYEFMASLTSDEFAKTEFLKVATRYREEAEKEQGIIDARKADREAAKSAGEEAAEEASSAVNTALSGNLWDNVDFSLSNNAKEDIKKTADEMYKEFKKRQSDLWYMLKADPEFDYDGENLSLYRSTIKDMIEAGHRETAEYETLVSDFRKLLAKASPDYSRINLLEGQGIDVHQSSVTYGGEHFTDLLEMINDLTSETSQTLRNPELTIGDRATTLKRYQEELFRFSADESLIELEDLGYGIKTDLENYAQSLGGEILSLTLESIKQGLDVQQTYDEAIVIGDHESAVQAQINAIQGALVDYISAGGGLDDEWVNKWQLEIEKLAKSIAKADEDIFAKREKAIRDSVDQAIAETSYREDLAKIQGQEFDKAAYQARVYADAIQQLQSLMLLNGKTHDEITVATAEWVKILESLITVPEVAETALQKATRNLNSELARLPLAEAIANALGEEFDPTAYKIDAYSQAIENLQEEMFASGASVDEVMKATSVWRAEIERLRASMEQPVQHPQIRMQNNLSEQLSQMPIYRAMAEAMGDTFDPTQYAITAYRDAISNLEKEMLDGGYSIYEIEVATRLWRIELNKLRGEGDKTFKNWAKELRDNLLSQMPILSSAMNAYKSGRDAFEGAKMSGTLGGVVGVLASLFSQSKTFSQIMANINPILQATADALGLFLQPLLPIVNVLGSVLTPVLSFLGDLLATALVPVMHPLFEGLKWVGVIANMVGAGLYWLKATILHVASALTGMAYQVALWFPGMKKTEKALLNLQASLNSMADDSTDKMHEMWENVGKLSKLTWTEALEDAMRVGQETAEALRNVPEGFKVALARFDATDPSKIVSAQDYNRGSANQIIINYTGDAYGYDDFRKTITDIVKEAGRNADLIEYGY